MTINIARRGEGDIEIEAGFTITKYYPATEIDPAEGPFVDWYMNPQETDRIDRDHGLGITEIYRRLYEQADEAISYAEGREE